MSAQSNPTLLVTGIGMTLCAGMLFATMDGFAKTLAATLPVMQVVWGRYIFHTLAVGSVLVARHRGIGFLRTRHPVLQFLRGMALLSSTLMMYLALSHIPLADATAVLFFSPVFVTLLSVVFLGERIGIHRIVAVIAGFVGVMLVVRPQFGGTDPWLLLPLGAVVSNSLYLMMTRRLAGREDAAATQFNTTAAGAVIMSVLVAFVWQPPTLAQWGMLMAAGLLGACGHSLLVKAFAVAPASLLSPFLYSQVIFASAISVAIFGDPMHPLTLAGTGILIASGVYIWWRENRRRLAVRPSTPRR